MSASSTTSLGTDAVAPGTELIVDRLAFRHHGIYLGEGLVIHHARRIRHPHALVETVPLQSFVGKRRVHVGRRPAESLHGEAMCVARAHDWVSVATPFSGNACFGSHSPIRLCPPCGNRGRSLEEGSSNGHVRW